MAADIDLMEGVAAALAAASHGIWRPAGVYAPGEHAIVLETAPQAPDTVTVLTAYALADDPTGSTSAIGLQVRTRGAGQDPRTARDMANDVYLFLHGRWAWTLPNGCHVIQIQRQSHVSGGRDDNQRHSVLQNFHADLYVPDLNQHPEETP